MGNFVKTVRKWAEDRQAANLLGIVEAEEARLAKVAETRKKPVTKWIAPIEHLWAKPLEDVKLVHRAHPSEEELTRFWANNTKEFMTEQAILFAWWFNSPENRKKVVSWKGTFTNWIKRADRDKPTGEMHKNWLTPAQCGCGKCQAEGGR